MSRGLFIGRFQPFHNGHLKAINDILKVEDEVIVCVAASQFSYTVSNPFSCGERVEMILRALREMRNKITVLSSPNFESNALWVENIVDTFPQFHRVYTNNKLVRILWEKKGYDVSSIDFYRKEELNGTSIRQMIIKGKDWNKLVPIEVRNYIREIEGEKRIKDTMKIEEKLRDGAV